MTVHSLHPQVDAAPTPKDEKLAKEIEARRRANFKMLLTGTVDAEAAQASWNAFYHEVEATPLSDITEVAGEAVAQEDLAKVIPLFRVER